MSGDVVTQRDGLTIMISSYLLKTTPSIIQLKPFEFENKKAIRHATNGFFKNNNY